MLENQAFGWLKLSIKGLGGSTSPSVVGSPGNSAAIGACSDPAVLVGGLSRDFDAVLRHASSSSSLSSSSSAVAAAPPANLPASSPSYPPEGVSSTTAGDGTVVVVVDDGSSAPTTSYADRLDDLTARLDRIKSLLYEERSGASSGAYRPGDWTPSIARGVFESFTTTASPAVGESSGDDDDDDDDAPTQACTARGSVIDVRVLQVL